MIRAEQDRDNEQDLKCKCLHLMRKLKSESNLDKLIAITDKHLDAEKKKGVINHNR